MTATIAPAPLAYDKRGAAAAAGVSLDVINRAIAAGALRTSSPVGTPDGARIAKVLILADDLLAWLKAGLD